jgi:hypothetical protein
MALSSKKLYFRHNNTTYSLPLFTAKHSTITIQISDGSNTYHALTDGAGFSSYKENGIKYFYNSSKPSIHSVSGGATCNAFNDYSSYDIPPGTYTPSAFRTLIEQYISNNGNRTVANAFTVTVNGQTITVSAGQKVYYTVNSSSPQGMVRSVLFNPSSVPASGYAPPAAYNSSTNGFTDGHCYVVYFSAGGYDYTRTSFNNYVNYNITIGTGINFS